MERAQTRRILILVALAVLAYVPALQLPFIADDYHQIPVARSFEWPPYLLARSTYMLLSAGLDSIFGFHPLPFYAVSILLHAACTLLIYAVRILEEETAFWAAAFFAVYEGHQEAVMWLAASADLLVFLFGVLAWLCWVQWRRYAASLIALALALASKESACVIPFLMLYRRGWGLGPHFALVGLYLAWIFSSRGGQSDIRFSIDAPWITTLVKSLWYLLFPWGLLALVKKRSGFPFVWMILGLLPYCFLTYMDRVPSRHTYLASAGLALLVGLAVKDVPSRWRAALAILVLAVNLEILWVKKMAQFRERAEPTELLKAAGLKARGTVRIHCTPLVPVAAEAALASVGAKSEPGRTEANCFDIEYTNAAGELVHEQRRLGTATHGAFH